MNFLSSLIFRRNTRPPYNALRSTTLNLSEKKITNTDSFRELYFTGEVSAINTIEKRNVIFWMDLCGERKTTETRVHFYHTTHSQTKFHWEHLYLLSYTEHMSRWSTKYTLKDGTRWHELVSINVWMGKKINKQRHALRSPFKVVKCVLNDKKKGNKRFNGPCICTRTRKK